MEFASASAAFGKAIRDSEFAIGPATGGIGLMQADQFWTSKKGHVRRGSYLLRAAADRFAGASIMQYLQAIGTRETNAIRSLNPPKQIALFCGPKLYRPDREKKTTALAWYRQVVDALVPKDTAITSPCLWHNDLHDDNVFVDPHNPERLRTSLKVIHSEQLGHT